jgi:ADP-heptose:LPS heptosyltransferase
MPDSRPQILVIRRRYLGDIVLLGSVFRNLRLHWPQARVTALVEAPYAGALAHNPDVNEVLVLPNRVRGWPEFLWRLRQAHFTHVFDFDNNERTALIARLSGAPFRATLWHEGRSPRLGWFYTHRQYDPPARHEQRHITDYYLSLLATAGVPVVTREVRLSPSEADMAVARDLIARCLGPAPEARAGLLLLHPGSRSAFRIWPAARFAQVCDRAQAELGVRAALVGAPGERELLTGIAQLATRPLAIIDSPLSVGQLAGLMSLADLLLCHDSGPMHIAAAVGTPVVALYGAQNAAIWRPIGDRHVILQPPLPCRNCVAPGVCVQGDSYRNYCVRNLTVEQVFEAVRTQLVGPPIAS